MFKTSKFSDSVNQDLEIRTLDILANSQNAMSIQDIQREDIVLAHHTSQKMARILGKLVDMGFVRKNKSKANNRMMYKSVSVMLAQGYEIEDEVAAECYVPQISRPLNYELAAETVE